MQEAELTWGNVASVWWLFTWRLLALLIAMAALSLLILLVLTVLVMAVSKPTMEEAMLLSHVRVLGLVLWFPASLLAIRMALKKRYRRFRIALIPQT
jgi:hypothetical protein